MSGMLRAAGGAFILLGIAGCHPSRWLDMDAGSADAGRGDDAAALADGTSWDAGPGLEEPTAATLVTPCAGRRVSIAGPEPADVFVDGRYSGRTSPAVVDLSPGPHTLALGAEATGYLRRRVDVGQGAESCADWLGLTPEALYACTTRDFTRAPQRCKR